MAKRKKSKAQQEYEKTRNRLLKARQRAGKRGSQLYFDLPETPTQLGKKTGQRVTARMYRQATKELTTLEKEAKEFWAREQGKASIPDASQQVVDNFLDSLGVDEGRKPREGAQIIYDKTQAFIAQYGVGKVAEAIMYMYDTGNIIENKHRYSTSEAHQYVSRMSSYMQSIGAMSDEEREELDSAFEEEFDFLPFEW